MNKYKIKWVVHPSRRHLGRVLGARDPVQASRYARYLAKIGAGFR